MQFRVFWKVVDDIELKTKQFVECVLELDVGQATGPRGRRQLGRVLDLCPHLRLDPLDDRLDFGLLRLLLLDGWHLTELKHVNDRLPRLQFPTRRQVPVEGMHVDVAFGFCWTVAFHAVLLEKWPDM